MLHLHIGLLESVCAAVAAFVVAYLLLLPKIKRGVEEILLWVAIEGDVARAAGRDPRSRLWRGAGTLLSRRSQ